MGNVASTMDLWPSNYSVGHKRLEHYLATVQTIVADWRQLSHVKHQ